MPDDRRHAWLPRKTRAAWLLERIRDAAASVAWRAPNYEDDAQAVWTIVVKRESEMGLAAETPWPKMPTPRPTASTWSGAGVEAETWLRTAEWVADLAIVASILSFVLAILLGVHASRYANEYGETAYHGWVIVFWIAVASFSALAWMGLAAALRVLAYIGRSQRVAASNR